jgi:hypothetical protein
MGGPTMPSAHWRSPVDMDSDSLIHLEYPTDGISRVLALSMLRYGPEVDVPRISIRNGTWSSASLPNLKDTGASQHAMKNWSKPSEPLS